MDMIVNGAEYHVEHTVEGTDWEEVLISDSDYIPLGTAIIDHNEGCVNVVVERMGMMDMKEYPYDKYEDAAKLAEWIITSA